MNLSESGTDDATVEAAAEAMWTLLAEREADPSRSICRNGPLRSFRDPTPEPWGESSGAWRQEMIDMAEAALAVFEDDLLAPLRLKCEVLREDIAAFRAQADDDIAGLREANRQLCDQARESKTARAEVIAEVAAALRASDMHWGFAADFIERKFGA